MIMSQLCAGLESDNWCLQAVVRGSSTSNFQQDFDPTSCFSLLDMSTIDHFALSDHQTTAVLSDELEQLYKPFYPIDRQASVTSSISSNNKEVNEEPRKFVQLEEPREPFVVTVAASYVPKYKKRKNEQKRVVHQVKADDLSSDKWSWRKYGQKPIKGSPYPRSYYKCSSSKGCLAKKQVEQSCTEPGIFLVTYTAEHNHSQPTRRNSLAGIIRNKFPTSKNSSPSSPKTAKSQVSITTHGSTSDSVECPNIKIKQEIKDEYIVIEGSDDSEFADMFGEDFYSGLEDLAEFKSSLGP